MEEVVKGKIWTFDQLQGVINVNVPIRSTVIKLKTGGLFVHNPVAPTKEFVRLIRKLEGEHGLVKYIVLPTLGIEHKGTLGPFAANFPKAEIYLQPDQYSFPVNLPSQLFLPLGRVIKDIPVDNNDAPWRDDIDHVSLKTLKPKGPGGYGETAFYHRDTQTLLVTDVVVRVDEQPPAIIQDDPRALLYHARDTMLQEIDDSDENRRKGWRRMVLFGLTFQPAGIQVKSIGEVLKQLNNVKPAMKLLGEGAIPFNGGFYPWDWVKSEEPNFKSLQGGLLVAPILRILIFNREPQKVLDWVDKICRWPFTRIIPAHLSNNLQATPDDFRAAFEFLYEDDISLSFSTDYFQRLLQGLALGRFPGLGKKKCCPTPLEEDLEVLRTASKTLTEAGTLYQESPLLRRR